MRAIIKLPQQAIRIENVPGDDMDKFTDAITDKLTAFDWDEDYGVIEFRNGNELLKSVSLKRHHQIKMG